jgi:probable rRNA maturation factor
VTVTDGGGRPVPDGGLARWLAATASSRVRGEVAIALVTDRRIRTLNRQYRGKDSATDVLSFPAAAPSHPSRARREPPALGDIVVATGVARRQARSAGHSLATELRVLALHGLLHLLGYDHDEAGDNGRMGRAEARLRRKGGLREGLIARARSARPVERFHVQAPRPPRSGGKASQPPLKLRRASPKRSEGGAPHAQKRR